MSDNRATIQYSRVELTHKLQDHFPRIDAHAAFDAAVSIRNYAESHLERSNYATFKKSLNGHLPHVPEKEVRKLFDDLYPDELPEAPKSKSSDARIGQSRIPGLKFNLRKSYSNLHRRLRD